MSPAFLRDSVIVAVEAEYQSIVRVQTIAATEQFAETVQGPERSRGRDLKYCAVVGGTAAKSCAEEIPVESLNQWAAGASSMIEVEAVERGECLCSGGNRRR